jgi:gliding motility-associated-like protein
LPDNAGAFSYTITNTTNPLTITGTSATAGPTAPITGLTPGVYNVTATLTYPNSPGCTATTSFTILQPSQVLDITGSSTPITCNPGNDGTITVQATGGWLGYTYSISPAVGNQTAPGVFENLSPNNYTITVTDALGCQDTFVVNLAAPQQITGRVDNVQLRCFGVNDGVATVYNVIGGENIPANYTYTLNYVNPTGASSGPQGSPVFNGLAPGNYTIVINDGLNCESAPLPFTVLPANEIKATLSLVTDSQVCDTGRADLELTVTGGTGTYQYSTSLNGPWTNMVSSSLIFPSLPVGQHTYYVRDTNNCAAVVSNTVSILQVPTLGINPIADIELDCSYATATITAKAFGGEGNYVYTLLPTNISNNTGIFTNLSADIYTIRVTSGDCTTVETTVNVTSPAEFIYTIQPFDTNCSYTNDGSLVVTLSGVDGRQVQYTLSSSDGIYTHAQAFNVIDETQPTFTISNLAGNVDYEIVVFTESSGCNSGPQTFRINRPLAVTATVTAISEECAEQDMAEIQITNISGGTAPYSVSYTSTSTVTPGGSSTTVNLGAGVVNHTFQGLDGGDYTVTITDANNCQFTFDRVIGKGDSYAPVALDSYLCDPATNSPMVRIEVQNTLTSNGSFGPGYQFQLDNFAPQNSPVFLSTDPLYATALSTSGNHTVFVYGPNNCDKIAQPDPLVVTPLQPLSVVLTNPVINTALATATGGSGNYTYTFYADGYMVQNGTKDTFVYYQKYDEIRVVVTDDSGCTAHDEDDFPYTPICIPDVLTPDGNGENDDWGPGCVDPTVYPRLVTLIYDRYGRLIATLPIGKRWDGKYEGKDLPSGDYWYVVKVDNNDAQEIVGHFSLYR